MISAMLSFKSSTWNEVAVHEKINAHKSDKHLLRLLRSTRRSAIRAGSKFFHQKLGVAEQYF
jgi:hypothetical protein